MMYIKVKRNDNPSIPKPSQGFHYVDQGNYLILPLLPKGKAMTMYSDSATSCIIVIIAATRGENTTVALAHLDSPACIQSFFRDMRGTEPEIVQVFAQGANPPDNTTSQKNAAQLKEEIQALGDIVKEQSLFLLEGNPREGNRGDFGFQMSETGEASVTNQPYTLGLTDRDPTCGGQTVYCIMRRQEKPPIEIRNAGFPFTHKELIELSSIAMQYRKKTSDPATAFTNIVNMQNAEILHGWSTTPEYEAPWFSDQLKQGACFALAMSSVVNLSRQSLFPEAERPFTRLRKSLLGE